MEIGQKIKALREEKGMTLEDLGNKVGVGKSTVRKWETGMIANMRRDKILKVADALGTDPAYLMGWEPNTTQSSNKGNFPEVYEKSNENIVQFQAQHIKLISIYEKLSPINQKKVFHYSENLLTNQQLEEELSPNAAHERGNSYTAEERQNDEAMLD